MQPLKIFIGYDRNEIVAYHTLCQSIIEKSTISVNFIPLAITHLKQIFWREKNNLQSTEFSFTRFLVPYLSQYDGWSLFMDCDMIVLEDISKLFDLADPSKAVMVCKHDYSPKDELKFLGQTQTKYEKKNWSSVMLFNNKECKNLTLDYVNNATGLELHQFKWLHNENLIGSLPLEWNWLVGEYEKNEEAKILHYTLGGPYFNQYKDSDYADLWIKENQKVNSVLQK